MMFIYYNLSHAVEVVCTHRIILNKLIASIALLEISCKILSYLTRIRLMRATCRYRLRRVGNTCTDDRTEEEEDLMPKEMYTAA